MLSHTIPPVPLDEKQFSDGNNAAFESPPTDHIQAQRLFTERDASGTDQPPPTGAARRPTVPPGLSARLPPSTGRTAPVTMRAASEARKITGPTISSGSTKRPIGMPL